MNDFEIDHHDERNEFEIENDDERKQPTDSTTQRQDPKHFRQREQK